MRDPLPYTPAPPTDVDRVWADAVVGLLRERFRFSPGAVRLLRASEVIASAIAAARSAERYTARREALERVASIDPLAVVADWEDAEDIAIGVKRACMDAIRAMIPGVGGSAGEPGIGASVAATPAAPTRERCPVCGSEDPDIVGHVPGGVLLCPGAFHAQPAEGEEAR